MPSAVYLPSRGQCGGLGGGLHLLSLPLRPPDKSLALGVEPPVR